MVYAYGIKGAKKALESFLNLDPCSERGEMGSMHSAAQILTSRAPRKFFLDDPTRLVNYHHEERLEGEMAWLALSALQVPSLHIIRFPGKRDSRPINVYGNVGSFLFLRLIRFEKVDELAEEWKFEWAEMMMQRDHGVSQLWEGCQCYTVIGHCTRPTESWTKPVFGPSGKSSLNGSLGENGLRLTWRTALGFLSLQGIMTIRADDLSKCYTRKG